MKSIYALLLLLFIISFSCKKEKTTIDPPIEQIPEIVLTDTSRISLSPNFEKYLIEKNIDPVKAADGFVLYRFVKDIDSLLFDAPIGQSSSLKGLEGFTNLRYFKSYGLMVDTLDFRHNAKLEYVEYLPYAHRVPCASLKVLDFGKISAVKNIRLENSQVSTLNLTNLKVLRSLYLHINIKLSDLDLSGCEALEQVYVAGQEVLKLGNHSKLTELTSPHNADVSKSPALERWTVGSIGLSGIDISHNPELKALSISEIHSPALDLTLCTKLESLEVYGHGDWEVTRLDLSKNKMLRYCKLFGTGLSTICISSLTETDFTYWEIDSGASYVKCN